MPNIIVFNFTHKTHLIIIHPVTEIFVMNYFHLNYTKQILTRVEKFYVMESSIFCNINLKKLKSVNINQYFTFVEPCNGQASLFSTIQNWHKILGYEDELIIVAREKYNKVVRGCMH